ncbi:hypothetical protein [Hymenobacter volaticus]|uniref:T9SS type A sorting domain-containing protein n=1 Tax=Hymenobacter volaticus TaxID=2932254 RepID=A0ABY4GE12_9BACT|nr:hypothetical protein [Hymenobacter volaticus]UOQ69093.1 hypothetical protein MUN86_26715 [Hymenobacter volaticus]
MDGAGNALVLGGAASLSVPSQCALLKYAAGSGQQLWEARFAGSSGPSDVAVDGADNVYSVCTSDSRESSGNSDLLTRKHAPTGQLVWEARYNGPGNGTEQTARLAVDAAANVYVTGLSTGQGTGIDFATLKYVQPSSALAGREAPPFLVPAPATELPLTLYPNPVTGPATVRFRPAQEGAAQVAVYNQFGESVATLYQGSVRRGQLYELSLAGEKMPAGLYTCVLLVGDQRESVRLVVAP